MRITRGADALTLTTATRSGRAKLAFRIPCPPGEPWAAVVDADGASRLARAFRPLAGGRNNGQGVVELERLDRSVVVTAGPQRFTVQALDPEVGNDAPVAGEVADVREANDLPARIAQAMGFCGSSCHQSIARGPFVYLASGGDGLVVPAVVATDGHRLFVDGDAHDCADARFVFQVAGDDWKPAAKALATTFDAVCLVREPVALPPAEEGGDQQQPRYSTRLVFESADRRVELAVDEPQTTLPRWSGFLPYESGDHDLTVTCDRDELAAAVKAVSTVGRQKNAACMLRGLPELDVLRICACTDYDGGIVRQDIQADIRRTPAGFVHLNGKYVLEALATVRTPTVQLLQHATPLDAVRLVEVGPDGTELRPRGIVIMPIRGRDPVESQHQSLGSAGEPVAIAQPA